MYLPKAFAPETPGDAWDLIEAHPFGTLVAADATGGLTVADLPFLPDRSGARLRAHVARGNPIAGAALAARSLVAVFWGPHGYVSARWYAEPDKGVPTWNYAVVHAHGRAVGPLPATELWTVLTSLTERHEGTAQDAWRPERLDHQRRAGLLEAIVGFDLVDLRLEAKLKLSDNRGEQDRARVRAALVSRGTTDDLAMVALMDRRRS